MAFGKGNELSGRRFKALKIPKFYETKLCWIEVQMQECFRRQRLESSGNLEEAKGFFPSDLYKFTALLRKIATGIETGQKRYARC